jgi:hypothetical protein
VREHPEDLKADKSGIYFDQDRSDSAPCAGVNSMVKLLRAHGGCLGRDRRRRTWTAAISSGKPLQALYPEISEWGNPPEQSSGTAR